ncbi:4Fe-4S dicluster domain-containing protein [Desulfoscipio geothermicus]|jgi:heterodisulfide reductase subunit C|uniref:Heterodisulfide reductase subunit C n=1 Tax=Desulfoscipio geothermicus DSM 3669 TaxID=1121426 RepID=A0A1I6DZ19_9FIRM|nr:4Fe-4S dicluster domain-containing protein [Desulfoscipio geothermicus]SFR10572.1 heterodisulfide reductase subunit C [Desulfoscipio geothermicus DSM 3669]
MALVNPDFVNEVKRTEEFNASACMNCGVCSAVCPMGLELLPRKLFRYVLLGLEDKVLANTETIYSCLLCKMCEANCPAQVHIAENVRFLRYYINKKVFKL